jgi:hypothetical protein
MPADGTRNALKSDHDNQAWHPDYLSVANKDIFLSSRLIMGPQRCVSSFEGDVARSV